MQFCGLSYDEVAEIYRQKDHVIDPSTLTKIRKKLVSDKLEKIITSVITDLISKKIIDGRTLLTDTTLLKKIVKTFT
jgi:hypothetical protein